VPFNDFGSTIGRDAKSARIDTLGKANHRFMAIAVSILWSDPMPGEHCFGEIEIYKSAPGRLRRTSFDK
jgi:hypothetical protein